MKQLLFICLIIKLGCFSGQTIPTDRVYNWPLFGLKDTSTLNFNNVDLNNFSLSSNGIHPNDDIIDSLITIYSSAGAQGVIFNFPTGVFLFNESIELPTNVILKGSSAENTVLKFNLNGAGHCIGISGASSNDTSSVSANAVKNSNVLIVSNSTGFNSGDWIRIIQSDADLVNNSWAEHTVGQIVKIQSVNGNQIFLESSLRMTYDLIRTPFIKKINPVSNVGIECLKIIREDVSDKQMNNIKFSRAVNCWIYGIESEKCNFSHIDAEYSSNISISKSYFHDAHNYGNGGKAYGIVLHFTTNECFIEDNIFEHLRHSMLLQAGANGNVFAYNYSFDPYWTDVSFFIPANSAGELVLHGNWPYANLFEQNIVDNIVIDNSHGANGPHNTFFRNRAKGYGIFFNDATSPSQNFVGNEVTNGSLPPPYNQFNYNILGTDQFVFGNNNLGTIDPVGTNNLSEISYAYLTAPDYIPVKDWASIGPPNNLDYGNIPSFDRYRFGVIFGNSCGENLTPNSLNSKFKIQVFPNPFYKSFNIKSELPFSLMIYNLFGKEVYSTYKTSTFQLINCELWSGGIYIIKLFHSGGTSILKVVKN